MNRQSQKVVEERRKYPNEKRDDVEAGNASQGDDENDGEDDDGCGRREKDGRGDGRGRETSKI